MNYGRLHGFVAIWAFKKAINTSSLIGSGILAKQKFFKYPY